MPERPGRERRRVALFLPMLAGGGAERMTLEAARQLSEVGLAVDLIVSRSGGAWWSSVPPSIRLVDLDAWKTPASLPGLVRYIRRERPDAMIATLPQGCATALIAKWFVGRDFRVIARQDTVYGAQYDLVGVDIRWAMATMRALLHTADAVLAVSSYIAEEFKRLAPKAAGLVEVVENPVVDAGLPAKATQPAAHPWFENSDIPIVLTVGRLEVFSKDHPTLLRAFAAVATRRPARLVVLGDGPDRSELEVLAQRLGIRDRVDFAGFRANPFALMARAQAFVLSSTYEGLPTVLIEALACGTSVVSTDCPGGVREVLEDGKWGRLVPVGDHAALADAICETLDNPMPPAELVRAATRYSTTASTRRLLGLLERVWAKA